MCIFRYRPPISPASSMTTALLWYRPGARRSKIGTTTATLACFAAAAMAWVLGPGTVFGQIEQGGVLALAEVGRTVELGQTHHLRPGLAGLDHLGRRPGDVVVGVGAHPHLDEAHPETPGGLLGLPCLVGHGTHV